MAFMPRALVFSCRFLTAALTAAASSAFAASGTLQQVDYAGYQTSDTSVTIVTTGEAKVRLDIASADVVRVWVAPSGVFRKDASFAVAKESWERVPTAVADQGSYLSIRTSRLAIRVNKSPVSVDFYQADNRTLITRDSRNHGVEWRDDKSLSIYRQLQASEHLYGLGQDNSEYLGTLDRRGTKRDLWTGQKINHGKVTADVPVPFVLSTGGSGGGYGLFFDNSYHSVFDLGATDRDLLAMNSAGGDALYYFIYGPSFSRIVERYTWLTGRPSLPNLWTLGFIQSKCSYYNWAEIDGMLSTMHAKNIPVDGVAIDFDWPEQIQNFQWGSRWNGDSPAKLREHGNAGVKFLLSQSGPMIRRSSSNYQDGLNHGIFATDGKGQPVTCGYYGGDLMDFTSHNMKDWLWPQISHLHEEGIKGWWLDLTEPEGEPAQTVYEGGPAAKIHNVFSLLVNKTYYEMLTEAEPNARPFLLTRTGFAGMQKYGAAVWTGDIYSDYDTLSAQVPALLNAGLSGMTAWTNDSGGFLEGLYKNDLATHGLLYERWLQFSAFTPITRAHHVGPAQPYDFGPAVEEGNRHYLQLRYQLLPYIYSYAWQTHNTGAPFVRPLVFDYQNDPNVTNLKNEFLFGRELLVAPVLTEATTTRSVYLPAGTWYGYEDDLEYDGMRSYQVDAPQHKIPLFVRAGAIIPMAPVMLNTDEKAWDPITLDVYPDGVSEFKMYADDGKTMGFEREQSFTETLIHSRLVDGESVRLSLVASNTKFLPATYVTRLHLRSTPTAATLGSRTLQDLPSLAAWTAARSGAFWDAKAMVYYVKFANAGATSQHLAVTLAGDHLSRKRAAQ